MRRDEQVPRVRRRVCIDNRTVSDPVHGLRRTGTLTSSWPTAALIRRSCSWTRTRRTPQVIQLEIRPLKRLVRRSQSTWTTRLMVEVAMVVLLPAPTARHSATGPDRLRPTGRKGSPKVGEKASNAPLPVCQVRKTHTQSDPSSVQHAEFRHDLAALGENPTNRCG